METLCDTSATVQSDPADIRRRVVELLAEAAERTGDARYRIAGGVVCGGRAGRRACDDSQSLAVMQVMLENGQADTVEKAARFAARGLPGEHSECSAVKRLASKYRRVTS